MHVCASTHSLAHLQLENSVAVTVAAASVVHTTLSIVVSRWRLTTLGLAVSGCCSLLPGALLKPVRKFVVGELTRLHNLSRSAFILDNYLCCLANVNPCLRVWVCGCLLRIFTCCLVICLSGSLSLYLLVLKYDLTIYFDNKELPLNMVI